jgi:hypothetical protein
MTQLDAGVLRLLEQRPGWASALERLGKLYRAHVDQATDEAAQYAAVYERRRASMVFDVVASRRRRYIPRVRSMVERFQQMPAAANLRALAEEGPGDGFGLRQGEGETMRRVAQGFLTFGDVSGLAGDDEIVERWATAVAPLEVAPELDPYVGAVSGIGIALFCYMRMRAGADAIKPDVRVRNALSWLGFDVPGGEASVLVVATTLADELGISRLVLDQLLWWTGNAQPAIEGAAC